MEWFWEIKQASGGPHYYLKLGIAPCRDSLEDVVFPLLSPDYLPEHHDWIHRHSGTHCYTKVTIKPSTMWVERGWGNDALDDDRFLLKLVNLPPVNWHWEVRGGGNGYQPILFREGNSLASLMQYSFRHRV